MAFYYQNLAKFETNQDELADKYENPDWCEYVTESTYHCLFANKNKGQVQLLTHFFEGAYLKKPDVAIKSFTAVTAKSDLGDYKLLPGNTKDFLESISLAIMFGWMFVDDHPDSYGINLESEEGEIKSEVSNLFKSQIESALEKCFKEVERLQGLAKCFGLFGGCLRSKQLKQNLNLLKQAEEEIERLGTDNYSKLISLIFTYLGVTLGKLERYEEALTSLDKAIKLNSNDSIAWENRGAALLQLERYEEALTSYNQAIDLNSDDSNAWNCRALFLSIQGDFDKAIADINQAIKIDSDKAIYIANKGIILARQGDYNEALKYCDQAISMDAKNEACYYAKACYYALQNDEQQTIENLSKSIDIAPRRCRLEAKNNPDFNSLKNNPQFQALLNGN